MKQEFTKWGWTPLMERNFTEYQKTIGGEFLPGRIIREDRGLYRLITPQGRITAGLSGAYRHQLTRRGEYPAVGDWVAASAEGDSGIIHAILPRRSALSRKTSGIETEEQVMGANIDKILIVYALDGEEFLRPGARTLSHPGLGERCRPPGGAQQTGSL